VSLGGIPGGTGKFFKDLSQPTYAAKFAIYVTQTLVGDVFNMYRSWLVWSRNYWVLVVPGPFLVGSAVSGYYTTGYLVTIAQSDDTVFDNPYRAWITTFYVLALVQIITSTSLIAYRLWDRERHISQYRASTFSFLPVMHIVIESAATYVLAQLVLVILYAIDDNAQYVVLESITPLIGIVFCLVITRVAIHSNHFLVGTLPSNSTGDGARLQGDSAKGGQV